MKAKIDELVKECYNCNKIMKLPLPKTEKQFFTIIKDVLESKLGKDTSIEYERSSIELYPVIKCVDELKISYNGKVVSKYSVTFTGIHKPTCLFEIYLA